MANVFAYYCLVSTIQIHYLSIYLELNPAHGEVYSIQHYVLMFVNDVLQVGGFLQVLRFTPLIKLAATI